MEHQPQIFCDCQWCRLVFEDTPGPELTQRGRHNQQQQQYELQQQLQHQQPTNAGRQDRLEQAPSEQQPTNRVQEFGPSQRPIQDTESEISQGEIYFHEGRPRGVIVMKSRATQTD